MRQAIASIVCGLLAATAAPVAADVFETNEHGEAGWSLLAGEYTTRSFDTTGGDISQSSWSLSFRGQLWRPTSRSILGHMPTMIFDAFLGQNRRPQGEGVPADHEHELGGFATGIRAGFPWTLVFNESMQIGVGGGFGIGYIFGRPVVGAIDDPALDIDGFLTASGSLYSLGPVALHGVYEWAPLGTAHRGEHRLRTTVVWGRLGAGLNVRLADLGSSDVSEADSLELGASVGLTF